MNKDGITFIEMVTATAIVTFLVLGGMGMMKLIDDQKNRSGNFLAQQQTKEMIFNVLSSSLSRDNITGNYKNTYGPQYTYYYTSSTEKAPPEKVQWSPPATPPSFQGHSFQFQKINLEDPSQEHYYYSRCVDQTTYGATLGEGQSLYQNLTPSFLNEDFTNYYSVLIPSDDAQGGYKIACCTPSELESSSMPCTHYLEDHLDLRARIFVHTKKTETDSDGNDTVTETVTMHPRTGELSSTVGAGFALYFNGPTDPEEAKFFVYTYTNRCQETLSGMTRPDCTSITKVMPKVWRYQTGMGLGETGMMSAQ